MKDGHRHILDGFLFAFIHSAFWFYGENLTLTLWKNIISIFIIIIIMTATATTTIIIIMWV
jgi:hypothetical protein